MKKARARRNVKRAPVPRPRTVPRKLPESELPITHQLELPHAPQLLRALDELVHTQAARAFEEAAHDVVLGLLLQATLLEHLEHLVAAQRARAVTWVAIGLGSGLGSGLGFA